MHIHHAEVLQGPARLLKGAALGTAGLLVFVAHLVSGAAPGGSQAGALQATGSNSSFPVQCPPIHGYVAYESFNLKLRNIPDTCKTWAPVPFQLPLTAERCWATCECKGFTINECQKTIRLAQRGPDEFNETKPAGQFCYYELQESVRGADCVCPSLVGYTVIQGKKTGGNLSGESCNKIRRKSLEELVAACNDAGCDCQGFDEIGCLTDNATVIGPAHQDACFWTKDQVDPACATPAV